MREPALTVSAASASTSAPGPRSVADLVVGGFERLSTVDWPGQLAAVVFCQGCAWRCAYCHNPHLLAFASAASPAASSAPAARAPATPSWDDILAWLPRRRGLLDAVVFSGGEATFQPGLPEALRAVRALGFKTGLHTGGPLPGRFAQCLPCLDWVGFDFKAPFDAYETVTLQRHGDQARQSLRMLRESRVACEIRTTWHPSLLSEAALHAMADTLVAEGFDEWVIQRFRPDGCLDSTLAATPVGELPPGLLTRADLRVRVR